ncbi:T9SS type A sorting domain-containing protein [Fulvivirgaceae bacterium PWU4]|uniref:T9SS type A sorting domain-containing protein n=1 Tax=Chryseosolibacter histidini TaxID=2782349 RepID=A0AAP2GMM2_9BACT|nr:MBG domain-containing protein [Chryseosolibacter histidini]MBT1701439.1 T9SS type A sorting domain-containing protein [Chryseosolibacter histidini]
MKKSVLLFCTILWGPAWLMAQPGSLDLTFNGTGRKEINFGNNNTAADAKSFAIVRDGSGNFFLAGNGGDDFAVLKLKANGTPDNTFGEGGFVIAALSPEYDAARALALDANGNIYLAGYANNGLDDDFALLKLKPDGTRDNSFGTNGALLIPGLGNDLSDYAYSIVINGDGDIFVGGSVESPSQYNDCAVYKIKPNGAFDNTFSGDGKLVYSMSSEHDNINAMAFDSDHNLVLVGAAMNDEGTQGFAVTRVKPDGSFDESFDSDGKLIIPYFGLTSYATEVVIDNNGDLYLAGTVFTSPYHKTQVVKLKHNGSLDYGYGVNGKILPEPFGANNFYGGNMVLDAAGNLILGGYAGTGSEMDFALTKVKPNGDIDLDFGGNGAATFSVGDVTDIGNAVLLDVNGNIFISGFAWNPDFNSARIALLKSFPGGALDVTFGNQGRVLFSAGPTIDVAEDMVFDSNGSLYVAGTVGDGTDGDFALVKLKPDGAIDNNFGGGDGKVIMPMGVQGYNDQPSDVAVDAAGNIFMAGFAFNGTNHDFAVLKLKPSGSPDPSFNGDGRLLLDFGFSEYVTDLLLDKNGRIYLIGQAANGNYYDFTIIRLKADGTLDATFNGNGKLFVSIGSTNDFANDAALDSDGNIYVTGQFEGGNGDYAVIKVKPDGTLDNTFSDDGKQVIPVGVSNDIAQAIDIDANGSIYIGGYSYVPGGEADLSLVKLKPDGSLDNSFSGDGKQIVSLPNSNDYGRELLVEGGNIYMAFEFNSINGTEMGIAKIKQDGTLSATFGTGGKAIYAGSNPQAFRLYQGELYLVGSNYKGDFLVLDINNKDVQNISALPALERTYGDAPITLEAIASSGLPVTYSSSDLSVASVSGNMVTILGAGNATITATQAGDESYVPASTSAALVVNKAVLTATANNKSRAYGQTNPAFTIAYQGFKNNETGAVINTAPTAVTQATTASDAGDYDIVPSGGADNNYTFAYVKGTLTINKADQVITFPAVPSKTLSSAAFNLSATASSSLPVVYTTSSDKVSLNGAQVTVAKAGRVSIKATQTGNKNYNAATAEVSFCIDPSKPLITASFTNPEAPVLTSSNNAGNQWYLNNTQISNATNATLTASQAGTYKVQTKADDCFSEFSNDYVLIVTGVEHNNVEPVSVYPNPSTDFVRISGVSSKAAHAVSAITGAGQSLPYTFEEGNLVIDVRTLAAGIYVVKFSGAQGARQVSFVKK